MGQVQAEQASTRTLDKLAVAAPSRANLLLGRTSELIANTHLIANMSLAETVRVCLCASVYASLVFVSARAAVEGFRIN